MSTRLFDKYSAVCGDLLQALGNARQAGRFAHAFLITAADAVQRREFALLLAQMAACRQAGMTGRPDGECICCRKLTAGTYPSFYELSPVGKMYQIRVGDRNNPEPNTIRSFIDRFGYTGDGEMKQKIGVIHDADRMNAEAQNALLKTLEEPPPDTLIILETGNPGVLLPTTRSRCQMISLPGNHVVYTFAGADRLFAALAKCCFGEADLTAAESAAQEIIAVAGGLAEAAAERVEGVFKEDMAAAASQEDRAFLKRMEERRDNAASGEYMRDRGAFLSAVDVFCSQIFMLSRGVALETLPNPEVFAGIELPETISESDGDRILNESAELLRVLKFPVNEELALRTFAVNLAFGKLKKS